MTPDDLAQERGLRILELEGLLTEQDREIGELRIWLSEKTSECEHTANINQELRDLACKLDVELSATVGKINELRSELEIAWADDE